MARSIVLFVIGVIAGAAAVCGSTRIGFSGSDAPLPAAAGDESPTGSAVSLAPVQTAGTTAFASERLAIFERVAGTDDTRLEFTIRQHAGLPDSRLRDLELQALLARYAELDPAAAVRLARDLYLETRFLEPLFVAWARNDTDAALAALSLVAQPAQRRKLGLAVLTAIGNDETGFERVAAIFPAADRIGFEIDALVARARIDPMGVLSVLIDREQDLVRNNALIRVAEMAAESEPRQALARIAGIDNFLMSNALAGTVITAWANADAAAVFSWLESASVAELPDTAALYETLAANDSSRLLAWIEDLPPALALTAQQGAVRALARSDPEAAVVMLDSMPAGQDRDQLLLTIAQSYGSRSPERALAWVTALQPASANAHASVLRGIADVDLERGADLLIAEIERAGVRPDLPQVPTTNSAAYRSVLVTLAMSSLPDPGTLLSRLAGSDDVVLKSMQSTLLSRWTREDTEAALAWTLANTERLEPAAFRGLAQELAATDSARAQSMMSQLPQAQRTEWFRGLAAGLAATNPDDAMHLLDRSRGQPGYDLAYGAVATELAQTDPAAAASMISDAPAEVSSNALRSASLMLASSWARSDPASAVEWVAGSADSVVQETTLPRVAQTWAQSDDAAAMRWIQSTNSGPVRDLALDGYFSAAAARGEFDPQILDAYSSPAQGQAGAGRALVELGKTRLEEATRLMNIYITDEAIRLQTEAALARTGGTGNNSLFQLGIL